MTFEFVIPQVNAKDSAAAVALHMNDADFAAFYERTARPIWAYLARVSRSPALADDLLQETYLRFLSITGPLPEGEVGQRRYLFRIATNLMRDHWRKPQPVALDDLPQEKLGNFVRDSASIDSYLFLNQVLELMSARERQITWLAYAEGFSHQQIAEVTGLRVTSIRILLFRARRKLAKLLRQGQHALSSNL